MLFFILAWTGLLLVCFVIGTAILNVTKADCFEPIGNRLIVAVWLGVVILSVVFLATSLIFPLSPTVGSAIAVGSVLLALRSSSTRTEITHLFSALSPKWLLGAITLELGVAALTSYKITWFDTGLYHFQTIQWLSQFGAVPGLALIHHRFGFTSSWFALAAPFNAGIFEARIGALLGGFVFLLALFHLLISLTHILKNQEKLEDWFLVTFLLLCSPYLAKWKMALSTANDLPVIMITGVVAWTIIVISSKRIKTDSGSNIDATVIPLILSAGATTMKLTALPLLFISSLFYLCYQKHVNPQRIFVGCAIVVLLILPMLGHGTITSGCPLYPSSAICFDLPWSVGEEGAEAITEYTRSVNQSSNQISSNVNSGYWLLHWIEKERLATFLGVGSILSIIGLIRRLRNNYVRGYPYLLALGVLGIAFVMYGAPSLRFGLGYFCLLPAFLGALYCDQSSPSLLLSQNKNAPHRGLITLLFLVWTITVVTLTLIPSPFDSYENYSRSLFPQFFLPPKIERPDKLLLKQVNDVQYFKPKGNPRCWASELPCTPENPRGIKLRIPEKGIGAGFIRD